jgi:hypothetical protein
MTTLKRVCMDIITKKLAQHNMTELNNLQDKLKDYLQQAVVEGASVHKVEKNIFSAVLEIGKQALAYFFTAQGDGDVGEKLMIESGEVKRLDKGIRYYQSIFGEFKLERFRYGLREGQKIACVPLDTRLELPESDYGFLLQEWSQMMAVEVPFKTTAMFLEKVFPIKIPVDSLEKINRMQAADVPSFRSNKKIDMEEEEAILVTSADGKGVPIRHKKDQARIEEHKRKKGPKPDRKRMAVVGSVYSVGPFIRTPEQIVEALFLDPEKTSRESVPKRPKLKNKQVIANLTREVNGETLNATVSTFAWIMAQINARNPKNHKTCIALMDGQPSLWEELHRRVEKDFIVEILDILHVTPRLWDAANIFYPNDKVSQIIFMKDRVLRVLKGQVKLVISGFRQMATKQNMAKSKLKKLERACHYLEKNLSRMKYHEYLEKGYPIASGVIEGACRHFVKDRMERAGMRWSIDGAQAMLDVRSTYLNDDWDQFTAYRIKKETERLHSNRNIIKKIDWPMVA